MSIERRSLEKSTQVSTERKSLGKELKDDRNVEEISKLKKEIEKVTVKELEEDRNVKEISKFKEEIETLKEKCSEYEKENSALY